MDDNASVLIATPAYGGIVNVQYASSLCENVLNLNSNGINTQWYMLANESLIQRGRNSIVNFFLKETSHDYLMFIDGDIGFPADSILQMLRHNKDIVCAPYPKKMIMWDKIKEAVLAEEENFHEYGSSYVYNLTDNHEPSKENALLQIKHGGTGFMLIKRRVFDKLKHSVPKYRISHVKDANNNFVHEEHLEFFGVSIAGGLLLSEDWHFCELWTNAGGKIYLDGSIRLTHTGTHVFDGNFSKTWKNIT